MCGIAFALRVGVDLSCLELDSSPPPSPDRRRMYAERVCPSKSGWSSYAQEALRSRGPDAVGGAEIRRRRQSEIEGDDEVIAKMMATTLHIRGPHPLQQPCFSAKTNVLAFNGEIFGGCVKVPAGQNDVECLQRVLDECGSDEDLCRVFEGIEGPFAFIYWHERSQTLWFGRDKLGRRSLVLSNDGELHVSSIALHALAEVESGRALVDSLRPVSAGTWKELPCLGLYSVCLDGVKKLGSLRLHPFEHVRHAFQDSSIVGWEHLVALDVHPMMAAPELRQFSSQADIVSAFEDVLSASVRRRVQAVDRRCDGEASVGVLFSGGIDSTVLALLADRFVPENEPIDLINFAFGSNPLVAPDRQTSINALMELRAISKRQWRLIEVNAELNVLEASRQRILELLCPSEMVMDFNIGAVMLLGARAQGLVRASAYSERIVSVNCRYTGLDEGEDEGEGSESGSGSGSCSRPTELSSYASGVEFSKVHSSCRVLLIGAGADEQLAGYGRHRTVYRRQGEQALRDELAKDLRRIWRRNLGRDDRLVSESGREARFPFLDESVMRFISSLPVDSICNLADPPGIGDKKLIRDLAARLQLRRTSRLQKRAIQFGTRIANKRVAGYASLSDSVRLSDIVNEAVLGVDVSSVNPLLCRKLKRRENKPGFE